MSSIIFTRWQHASRSWSCGVHLVPHFAGRGGHRGSAMVSVDRAMVVSYYRLSIVTVALSVTIRLQFAVECLRRSNQQRLHHFGVKFGQEVVNRCKPNFNAIWGCRIQKKRADIFCHLSTMHKRDRQKNHITVTSITNR